LDRSWSSVSFDTIFAFLLFGFVVRDDDDDGRIDVDVDVDTFDCIEVRLRFEPEPVLLCRDDDGGDVWFRERVIAILI
jgi:hypothetical protein